MDFPGLKLPELKSKNTKTLRVHQKNNLKLAYSATTICS